MPETMFRFSVGQVVWFLNTYQGSDGVPVKLIASAKVVGLWADDCGRKFLFLDRYPDALHKNSITERRWIREDDANEHDGGAHR